MLPFVGPFVYLSFWFRCGVGVVSVDIFSLAHDIDVPYMYITEYCDLSLVDRNRFRKNLVMHNKR